MVGSFWIVAEQILIQHGLYLLLCSAVLVVQVLSLTKLTEDLEGGPLGPAVRLTAWGVGRRQVLCRLGLGQFGE